MHPYSQTCGYHSSPPDVCQFCSKIEHFFQGGSGGAMSHTSRKSSRSRCSQLEMVWEMRFQIEKMCCGREVIASQILKSSKKWMLGRWRGDVEVMHPQISDYMHTTAWASIIATHSNFTCKEKMNVSTVAVFVHPPSTPEKEPNIQFLPNPPGGFSFYNETDLRVRVPKSREFDVSCWRVQITSHKKKS